MKKSNLKTVQQDATLSNSAQLPTEEELKKYYRDMLLVRRFEEKAGQLYGMGLIGGFVTCISVKKQQSPVSSLS